MNSFTWIFLAALLAGTALRLWLDRRQARHVSTHAGRVPEPFAGRIDLEAHRKAAAYTLARLRLDRAETVLGTLLLLGWTLAGGLQWLDTWLRHYLTDPVWQGTALLALVMLVNHLIELPLDLAATFGVEARFGFNRTTPRRYVQDQALGLVLSLVLGVPLIAAILWIMTHSGAFWWLAAWGLWMAFSLFVTWAYPVLIAPLFNRFQPLADTRLRQRLEALLRRCGFRSKGMYVMDGSRRSAHGNAYFTGFGRNKRIVFFDTLLADLTPEETEAVLAHELGHFRHHHVAKGLALTAILALAGFALLGWLAGQPWFYHGLGVERVSPGMALTLFVLTAPVFILFVRPLFSALSRRHEFEADAYAARQADTDALISALVRMYRENASTLTPDPLYAAFHYSHPVAVERIEHLKRARPTPHATQPAAA